MQEEQERERSRTETVVTNLQTENSELKDILCLKEREIRELKEQHTADVGNATNRSEGEDAKEQHLEEVRNLRRIQRTREEEAAEEIRELNQMLRNREEKIESLKEQHLEEERNLRRIQHTREEEAAEERRELSQMLRNREEKIESLKVGMRRCTLPRTNWHQHEHIAIRIWSGTLTYSRVEKGHWFPWQRGVTSSHHNLAKSCPRVDSNKSVNNSHPCSDIISMYTEVISMYIEVISMHTGHLNVH
ncbi:trichohyalin-like [Penaeus japonicus]|uniref:trichohyalin-like n=1 Tax=Penaeus japonicus TaxID=27405 RepID=UPI001C70B610|nr:trichohyalin-like [Penaeus japonicus]